MSEDSTKLLISIGAGFLAMLDVLPDDEQSPFRLLWSKQISDNWFGLGSATFSWNGDLLAVSTIGDYSDAVTYVLDSDTGDVLYELSERVYCEARLRFTPDDEHLLVWGYTKYIKAEARTGNIVYKGDFLPSLAEAVRSKQAVFQTSVRPHPAYKDVWVFKDQAGNTMAYDERQKRPVWIEPEFKEDRWLGAWWIHADRDDPSVFDSKGDGYSIGIIVGDFTERNQWFFHEIRAKGEHVSVRSLDKKTISIYSILEDKKLATVPARNGVWSQSYELMSAACAINIEGELWRGDATLAFYALDGSGHKLTLFAESGSSPEVINLIVYTPSGAYALYGEDEFHHLRGSVTGQARHDPAAVREVLTDLLRRPAQTPPDPVLQPL